MVAALSRKEIKMDRFPPSHSAPSFAEVVSTAPGSLDAADAGAQRLELRDPI
jgi:hypothetical protein